MEKGNKNKEKKLFIDNKTLESYDGIDACISAKIKEDLKEEIIKYKCAFLYYNVTTTSGKYLYKIVFKD